APCSGRPPSARCQAVCHRRRSSALRALGCAGSSVRPECVTSYVLARSAPMKPAEYASRNPCQPGRLRPPHPGIAPSREGPSALLPRERRLLEEGDLRLLAEHFHEG